MQFLITASETPLSIDERAYIEFSLFKALRRFAGAVTAVSVHVAARSRPGGRNAFTCVAHADSTKGVLVARASTGRLYSTIDLVAGRLAVVARDALDGGLAGRAATPRATAARARP